jgi:sulfur transfer complex TusBCD TusB component (DsrH family)
MENYGEIKICEIYGNKEYVEIQESLKVEISKRSYYDNPRYNILLTVNDKIYLNSDNILNILNKPKLLEKLKENNSYIIHIIDIKYKGLQSLTYGNNFHSSSLSEKKVIVFIDNYCNYYLFTCQGSRQGYHNGQSTGGFEHSNDFIFSEMKSSNKIKLHNSVIKLIKQMKGNDILIDDRHNNICEIFTHFIKLNEELISELNESKILLKENQNEKDKEIALLKSKLAEQTKLNEDICQRMFELKEQLLKN